MCRVLLGLAISLAPTVALAQKVPLIAVEVAAGTGSHSESSGQTWFREPHKEIFHIGSVVRLVHARPRFAAIGRLEYNSGGMADQTSDCPLAPNGTCRRYFPKTEGWAGGLGLAAAITSRLNIELGIGAIRSTANRYVSAGASVAFATHFAALAEWRYFDLQYAGDRRVSFRPVQAGIRVF
jgi:hypothetical protein